MTAFSSGRRADRISSFCCLIGVLLIAASAYGETLVSPSWGFTIDLPEAYSFVDGDGVTRFSFAHDSGAMADLVVYAPGRYADAETAASDIVQRLSAEADISIFNYNERSAALMNLAFTAASGQVDGWALCVELDPPEKSAPRAEPAGGSSPILLVLAYGPSGIDLMDLHVSALDSVAPSAAERFLPGPVSAFAYPAKGKRSVAFSVQGKTLVSVIDEDDAEANQAVVDREFSVLSRYLDSPFWREAWRRFYRTVYRDAFDRLAYTAFAIERALNIDIADEAGQRLLAQTLLSWVQDFSYERDPDGSDFVNLVSAATEQRGDCDSRALLMALILHRSNIMASMMVSKEYSHAMALVNIPGSGARFSHSDIAWLVGETTAKVSLGLIAQDVADPSKWLGISLP